MATPLPDPAPDAAVSLRAVPSAPARPPSRWRWLRGLAAWTLAALTSGLAFGLALGFASSLGSSAEAGDSGDAWLRLLVAVVVIAGAVLWLAGGLDPIDTDTDLVDEPDSLPPTAALRSVGDSTAQDSQPGGDRSDSTDKPCRG